MASDTSEIPAAYFTTFSISDPDGLVPTALGRAQKRKRRVFVCIPCHRKKLKCDRLLPCSRCLAAGIPGECSYQPPPAAKNSATKGRDGEAKSSAYVGRPWHGTKRDASPATSLDSHYSSSSSSLKPLNGTSHWSRIACELEEATPYLFGTEPRWQNRYHQVKSLECLFAGLDDNTNFPFGSPGSTAPLSKTQILHSFPPNHVIDTLVANYLGTFGATHCLVHPSQPRYDIQPDVSDEWLAHFCMVLALGAETASDYLFSGLGQSSAEWAGIFLTAAQASFGRSPYMAAPSLTTVRTLCLMVIAKLLEMPASGGSCGAGAGGSGGYAPLVSLMAFTVRTAKSLQLHRPVYASPYASDSLEMEMRCRIWTTVLLLDLETALRAGTTTHSDAGDEEILQTRSAAAETPSGSRCMQNGMCKETACFCSHSEHGNGRWHVDYDGSYQDSLASFVPLLTSIINTVNSPTKPGPSSRQVADWDARVRRCLADIGALVSNHADQDETRTTSQIDHAATQFQHLETVTHRVLLALHHNMFSESLSASSPRLQLAQSQSVVVESSLALLRTQNKWSSGMVGRAGRCPSTCATSTTAASVISADAPFSRASLPDRFIKPAADMPDMTDLTDLPDLTEMTGMTDISVPLSGRWSPAARVSARHATAWLLDLCHTDFAAALMYMVLALRAVHQQGQDVDQDRDRDRGRDRDRDRDQDRDRDDTGSSDGLCRARENAAAIAVHGSYQIMRDRCCRSVGHFKEFLDLAIYWACFRGLHSGDLLSQVVDATNDVEQVVVAGRRYLLWAADSYMPDEALIFPPLVAYGAM